MNNMQKAFDKKSALRRIHMADGGLVDKAKTDIGSRAATIDNAEQAAVAAKPAPAPVAAPAPKPMSEDAQRAAVGMAPKKGFLRSLLGMAEGGHVRGPGGPREDKVPAMLSNGEYVLPAKTVQHLGGPEELDELVQQTNDGRAPRGNEERGERHGLRRMATGGAIEIDANGRPMTNGVNVLRGNQLATIPGEVAQTPRIPGTSLVPTQPAPTQPAPTPPPAATPQPQVQPQPSAAAPKPGMLSRVAGAGLRMVGGALPTAIAQQGFNDYEPTDRSVPYDATSQLRMLAGARQQFGEGNFSGAYDTAGNLGKSLGNSLISTAADVGSGTAKVIDSVGGFFGQDVGAKKAFDQSIKDDPNFSPLIRPKIPGGGALQPGSSQAGAGRGFVNPQTLGIGPGPEGLLNTNGGTPTDAAPSPRSLAQARYNSEHGVDAATQASAPVQGDLRSLKTQPGQFLNLGSFQGPDNIYGTSSKPGGRVNSFVGAGDPNRQETPQTIEAVKKLQSDLAADKAKTAAQEEAQRQAQASQGNSGSINARFDAMANKVAGSYSPMGKGNESKRLLEIETQRNNALEADARNNASIRGQNQQLQIAQANNAVQARGQDIQLQGHQTTLNQGLAIHRDTLGQQDRVFGNTVKQQAQAQEEQNVKDRTAAVDKLISRRFPDANKSGSPDGEKAIDYQNFIAKQDPKLVDAYTKGNATQRDEALSTIDRLFETREKVNARGSSSLRGNTSLDTVLPVGNARNVEFGDYWGQGSLPWSNLPRRAAAVVGADAGKVQQMSNGQVVPLNDLTNDDSSVISNGKNASKVSALHQQRAMQAQLEAEARRKQLESIIQKR